MQILNLFPFHSANKMLSISTVMWKFLYSDETEEEAGVMSDL